MNIYILSPCIVGQEIIQNRWSGIREGIRKKEEIKWFNWCLAVCVFVGMIKRQRTQLELLTEFSYVYFSLFFSFPSLSLYITGCAFLTYCARESALKAQSALHEQKTLPGVRTHCKHTLTHGHTRANIPRLKKLFTYATIHTSLHVYSHNGIHRLCHPPCIHTHKHSSSLGSVCVCAIGRVQLPLVELWHNSAASRRLAAKDKHPLPQETLRVLREHYPLYFSVCLSISPPVPP